MKSDKALFELMGCPWAGLGMMITLAVALTEGCRWSALKNLSTPWN